MGRADRRQAGRQAGRLGCAGMKGGRGGEGKGEEGRGGEGREGVEGNGDVRGEGNWPYGSLWLLGDPRYLEVWSLFTL